MLPLGKIKFRAEDENAVVRYPIVRDAAPLEPDVEFTWDRVELFQPVRERPAGGYFLVNSFTRLPTVRRVRWPAAAAVIHRADPRPRSTDERTIGSDADANTGR
jgi:hypothetical protein